jgi:hypothetical protein
VLLLPDAPVYVPGVGLAEAGSDIPPPLPDRYSLLRRYSADPLVPPLAPAQPLQAEGPLVAAPALPLNHEAALAPAAGRRSGRFGWQRFRRS